LNRRNTHFSAVPTPRKPLVWVLCGSVLLVGLSITLAAHHWAAQAAHGRLQREFAEATAFQSELLRNQMRRYVELVDEVAEKMIAIDDLDPQRFQRAVRDIPGGYPGLVAVEWTPWVLEHAREAHEAAARAQGYPTYTIREIGADGAFRVADRRAEYFPIRSIHPPIGNEAAVGFDSGSEPRRLEPMILARDTAGWSVTAPTTLVQNQSPDAGILLFHPIYRGGGRPHSIDERRARFLGLVTGVLRVQSILASGELASPQRLAVNLTDFASGSVIARLHADERAANDKGLTHSRQIEFAGRGWLIEFAPTASYLNAQTSREPLLALLAGLAITLALMLATSRFATQYLRVGQLASSRGEQLAASRERLELALEGSRLALWDLNLVTREVFLSAAWSRMLGVDAGASLITLDRLFATVHPDDVAAVDCAFKNALTGAAEYYAVNHRAARPDGAWIWVRSHGKVTERDTSGRALRMVGTNADITREKSAEAELAKRDLELHTIYDNIPASVARLDRDLRFRYTNGSNALMLGRPAVEIVGATLPDLVGQAACAEIAPYFEQALNGIAARYERRIERDGKAAWLDVTLFPDIDANGSVQGCFLVSWDVTQRVLAEQALKAGKLILERTLAHLPIGVMVTDADLDVVAYNEAYVRLLEFPAQFLIPGDPLEKALRYQAQRGDYGQGDTEEQIASRLQRARHFEPVRFERVRADNVVLEVQGVPVPGGGYVRLFSDVSARKDFERQLVEAREHAESSARAKGEFLAVMSHEIRTPMNGVLGLAQVLLDTELNAEQRAYAETLYRAGRSLLTILNNILDLSKIEASMLTLEQVPFDLEETVGDVLKLAAPTSAQKGLDLQAAFDPACPRVLIGDPGRIRQVLNNLVGNAIKFTQRGRVLIQVTCQEHAAARVLVRFSVEDTGIGIAAESRTRLFEPFVQADASTTRRFGGTGLGLAICRRLVELMGGRIDVQPGPEGGSCFRFDVAFEVCEIPCDSDVRRPFTEDADAANHPHVTPLKHAALAQR
jgi:PAS domain S-box-containing protein